MIFKEVLFLKSGKTSPRLPPVQYLSAFWDQSILIWDPWGFVWMLWCWTQFVCPDRQIHCVCSPAWNHGCFCLPCLSAQSVIQWMPMRQVCQWRGRIFWGGSGGDEFLFQAVERRDKNYILSGTFSFWLLEASCWSLAWVYSWPASSSVFPWQLPIPSVSIRLLFPSGFLSLYCQWSIQTHFFLSLSNASISRGVGSAVLCRSWLPCPCSGWPHFPQAWVSGIWRFAGLVSCSCKEMRKY